MRSYYIKTGRPHIGSSILNEFTPLHIQIGVKHHHRPFITAGTIVVTESVFECKSFYSNVQSNPYGIRRSKRCILYIPQVSTVTGNSCHIALDSP